MMPSVQSTTLLGFISSVNLRVPQLKYEQERKSYTNNECWEQIQGQLRMQVQFFRHVLFPRTNAIPNILFSIDLTHNQLSVPAHQKSRSYKTHKKIS